MYLQNPSRHFFGVAPVPPHCVSSVQFGFGLVSTTHAPWSQNLPLPHSGSPLHGLTQLPPAHFGVSPEHCVSSVQLVLGAGSHAPLLQTNPAAHAVVAQLARHWPSAQI